MVFSILNRNLNVYGPDEGFVPKTDDEVATNTHTENGALRNDGKIMKELMNAASFEEYTILLMSRNSGTIYGYTHINKITDNEDITGKRIHFNDPIYFSEEIPIDTLNTKTGGQFTLRKVTDPEDIELFKKIIKKMKK